MVILRHVEEWYIDEEPSNKCHYHSQTSRVEPHTVKRGRERRRGGGGEGRREEGREKKRREREGKREVGCMWNQFVTSYSPNKESPCNGGSGKQKKEEEEEKEIALWKHPTKLYCIGVIIK